VVSAIRAQLSISRIRENGLELRYEWDVNEVVTRHLLDVVKIPWFSAEGTDVEIGIFSCKRNA